MSMMSMDQVEVLNDQVNELIYERAERYDEGDFDAVAELDYQIFSLEDQISMLEDSTFTDDDFEDNYFDNDDGYDDDGYAY